MIHQFENLTPEETELMLEVPILVSVLIAGADSTFDKAEIKEAISVSRLKQKKARKELIEYYQAIGDEFESRLRETISHFPDGVNERNEMIINRLKELNDVLPKLDRTFAIKFYESMKDIAKRIAEASGGVLGYMAIGYEESKLIDLKMIKNPADYK